MTSPQEWRTAIVTGAASGIGYATVVCLLEQGWRVAALDRDADALARAEKEWNADNGRLRLDAFDVTDTEATDRIVADIAKNFGPLRGLIACAGIGANVGLFETTPDLLRRMNDVNVIGTFLSAKAAAEAMRGHGGAIVTVASVSGLLGNFGRAAYGASKGAVINLTQTMAVELGRHNIRVNSIAPGPIETAMSRELHSPEVRAEWCDKVLLRRYGTPKEIAEVAAFLVDGNRSSYITGQVIAVDGGFVTGGLLDPA